MAPGSMKLDNGLGGIPVAVLPFGPGATNHFEAGGFIRGNDDVAYPNLMFHFLPIAIRSTARHLRAGTATRCTSARCTPTRAARSKITSEGPRVHPALPLQLPLDRAGPAEWVEAVRTCAAQPHPACVRRRSTAVSSRRGRRWRPTRRFLLGRRATRRPRSTHRAPAGSASTRRRYGPATKRVHGVDGLRVVDTSVPLRDERQHLRADDHGGEGGGPDPGATPLVALDAPVYLERAWVFVGLSSARISPVLPAGGDPLGGFYR